MSLIFKKVVFIDDDPIQNYLNMYTIKKLLQPADLDMQSFTDPEKGFRHIVENCITDTDPTVLFLDINMPQLSGWEIMDELAQLQTDNLPHIAIYLLSSSVDPADIKRAKSIPLVSGFISKPMNAQLSAIFEATIAHHQSQ